MTETAEADLAEIWAYLASEAGDETATRFINEVYEALEPARAYPSAGARRDVLSPGLCVLFAGPYAVYYKSDRVSVLVIRVIHGARDLAALVERGGFAG